ncbi:exported hypothetical protein [Desulfamplus magnetovallimortis]|uniref:Uncharacterized protein n=1 Tax=Desulfamplus magnetovallimortis TaxID=1246637 RepID=A0A1W1HH65_9BACT|nr:NosD domain-containing protein [Desulfamplus magnetovallimortis]SLM31773.1 exported hypothetical protein [Desulfamplus magnetovallimortis]
MIGTKKNIVLILALFLFQIFVCTAHAVVDSTDDNLEENVVIRVLNSDGAPLKGVQIKYQTSSWYDAGDTDSNGEVFLSIPEKYSTITARAHYNGGRLDIRQDIRTNPEIEFHTVKTVVSLVNSEGVPLEGGFVQYVYSSWADFGVTNASGEAAMELLPTTYTFRMSYDEGRVDIKQDIGENPNVIFQTIKVNVRLEDSDGNGLEGGSIIYVRASWIDYGLTDASGNAYRELLTGTYTFRMSYDEGRVDIKQEIGADPIVLFKTSPVTVRLEDSEGNGLEGGRVRYSRASWNDFGVTGTDGNVIRELLDGTYTFRMYVDNKYEDQKSTVAGSTLVNFVSTAPPAPTYSLYLAISPESGGSVVVSPEKSSYSDGENITFSVTPSEGYRFISYGGTNGTEVTGNSLTMNADKSVTLFFEEIPVNDEYHISFTVTPQGGGSISVSPQKDVYNYGDVVEISADAAEGYEFVQFTGEGLNAGSGSATVSENPYSFEVTENVSFTAFFQELDAPDTIIVRNIDELNQAEIAARDGNLLILIDDGEYVLSDQFMVRGDNVTVKSLNGDASKVIVRGKGMDGNVPHVFSVYSDNFTVEDITLGWVRNHGIQVHGELDADNVVVRNVHFRDTYEQMLKISYSGSQEGFSDNGLVEGCSFIYTAGTGPQYYIGGVDGHKSKGWIIRNNLFQDIISPSSALSEGAVHFWSDSTDTIVENNLIINCDRGIMFGLDSSHHHGGVVRNNFIHVNRDVGIYMANAHNTQIYNNTIFLDSNYINAIEYRFEETDVQISNNLTNKAIASRNGGIATISNNVDYAVDSWFVDPYAGDLHLAEAVYVIIDQGMDIDGLTHDIDGDSRESGKIDIGADEVSFELKTIVEIFTEASKTEILSNGKDVAEISTRAVYEDGSEAYINADTIVVTDSNGNSRTLSSTTFTSFVTGEYTIVSSAQDVSGTSVVVNVVEENLTQVQASNISLMHRDGQTFITFEEIVAIVDDENIYYDELYDLVDSYPRSIEYRIYSSDEPITEEMIATLEPVGSVNILSGWNLELWGIGTYNKHAKAIRYVIEDNGAQLGLSQGLFVYNPPQPGLSWYAVTAVVEGVENRTVVENENMAVVYNETVGQGTPVLQRVEFDDNFQWVYDVELYLYTRWEAPPNSSVMGKPYDYLVGKPSNMANPAPVGIHLHCWGGNLYGGYGWWNDAEDGALILASNQYPYDWWTGYHEKYYDKSINSSSWADNGVVRPYSTTRMISFLDWMETGGGWNIDRSRTFTAGSSMGGSGTLMMAIRYPELFSWSRSWVGVHVPEKSPNFKSSYQGVFGKPEYGVLFESFDPDNPDNGTPVWDYYNDVWYLKNHVEKSIGFLSFCNGKNDNAIGWEQAVDFINALQETRQPHLFIWGQAGHSQRTYLPKNGSERHMVIDVRVDQSLPAFTGCTLDDVYGNGDPNDGDASGQVNRYLYWETDDLSDTVDSWGISVALMDTAPEDNCKVDITPRRLQEFYVESGETVSFINIDSATNTIIESGEVTVDEFGLITILQTTISKTGNRIVITPSGFMPHMIQSLRLEM